MNDQPHLQRKADEDYLRNEARHVRPAYKGGNPRTRHLILVFTVLAASVAAVTIILWS